MGAVVLTNGDPGWLVRDAFRRKLLTIPAEAAEAGKLAGRYHNDALGDIVVQRGMGRTVFDFDEWRSEVASRKNPDGTISFLTIMPGLEGFEFVVGGAGGRRPAAGGRRPAHAGHARLAARVRVHGKLSLATSRPAPRAACDRFKEPPAAGFIPTGIPRRVSDSLARTFQSSFTGTEP